VAPVRGVSIPPIYARLNASDLNTPAQNALVAIKHMEESKEIQLEKELNK